jgi:hypothetical protein
VVCLVACGSGGIVATVFRGRRARASSEQDLARKITVRGWCGPGMLVTADRNFGGYPVALAATGADLLIGVQWLPAGGAAGRLTPLGAAAPSGRPTARRGPIPRPTAARPTGPPDHR